MLNRGIIIAPRDSHPIYFKSILLYMQHCFPNYKRLNPHPTCLVSKWKRTSRKDGKTSRFSRFSLVPHELLEVKLRSLEWLSDAALHVNYDFPIKTLFRVSLFLRKTVKIGITKKNVKKNKIEIKFERFNDNKRLELIGTFRMKFRYFKSILYEELIFANGRLFIVKAIRTVAKVRWCCWITWWEINE